MIECLATAHFNRPDLTQRMIASIDFPVKRLLIVHNGTDSLHELKIPGFVAQYDQIVNGENKGCAGAWNQSLDFGLEHNCSVLIVGNDIEFHTGDLKRFHDTQQDFPEAEFIFGNHSYSNFMVTLQGLARVGWFDENFYPAYYEDGDHWQRIIRSGAKAIHAAGLHSKHEGSATIKSDISVKAKVDGAYPENQRYYSAKWGGLAGNEIYTHPFNNPELRIGWWQLSEKRAKQPHFHSFG